MLDCTRHFKAELENRCAKLNEKLNVGKTEHLSYKILNEECFSAQIPGISFDQVITRACQRDPTLRYCIEARDRNITSASGGRSQYASKNTGRILPEDDPGSRVFNRLLADPVAEKEVFRSSTRELPLHEASSASTETNDPFCDEDEDRYNHYCHDVIERSSSTQQELFKYCIDYEIKCPHKTVNKKVQ
ncbi:unnamed protein product [Gongylonema pulchrum]|uniref:CPG4 domain-containing protein n=1 Tax=Gongylonema pulchrum TaxID=637853 RepID=A0A183EFL1_9BILA|nr:unnamed protein product [Gongylonema pulchrum]